MKLGRNDPCHCGSGKKYKKCHEQTDAAAKSAELSALAAQAAQRQAELDEEADKAKKDGTAARAPEPAGPKRPAVSAPKPAPLRRRFV